nr:MAG TPA_asm: hypothetical protein [Caudoviricetes sp.]DAM18233.1 MAG TPA: hypothetical protein [Caudoviricetes sp.]DAS89505.1 MAG TPA: hypothetical protein [Caudoviricetes sp.]
MRERKSFLRLLQGGQHFQHDKQLHRPLCFLC